MANHSTSEISSKNWGLLVWEFAVHVLIGTVLFAIIFTPAIGLELLIYWLKETVKISQYLQWLLIGTKYLIATTDVVLYLFFMGRMSWFFVKSL